MNPLNLPEEKCINENEDERLPNHLIFDNILPRLPVKPLIRFKSVSKNWCSSISTPEFSKSHLSFSSSRPQFLLLQKEEVSAQTPNFCLVRLAFEIGGEYIWIRIVGSCNGLVCLSPNSPQLGAMKFCVFNPATGHRVEILGPGDERLEECINWFGYVSSIEDYMIVSLDLQEGVFWTFSRKGGIWKRISFRIENYDPLLRIKPGWRPVLVDDCLYWPLDVYRFHINMGTHILELNLVREEYEVKPKMKFAHLDEPVKVVNLKGCLALYATTRCPNCISVWKLKHKDDWNSWEKVVDSKNLEGVGLIYYSPTGKLVVDHRDHLRVVEDLSELPPQGEESNELGKLLLHYLPSPQGIIDYVESLISPV